MGEAAERLDWVFPDPPAVKLRLIRSHGSERLTEDDLALLDVLEATYVRRWIDTLSTVDPARAAATAEALWHETASAWRNWSPRLTEMLRRTATDDGTAADEDAVLDALSGALPDALDYVPNLSSTAAVYARAFVTLIATYLQEPDAEARETVKNALAGRWPHDERLDSYMALLHGFVIAGLEERIPEPVVNALAPAFWARMRAFAEDDDDFRSRMDRALRDALSKAKGTPHEARPDAVVPAPERGSVLARLRKQAGESPGSWASVPTDASQNLDKYLYGR